MRASKSKDSTPGGPNTRLLPGRLQAVMDLAKWSKSDLAELSGLDQSVIGRLLSGDLQVGPRSIPGLVGAIRERFGDTVHTCNLFEILGPDGQPMTCLCSLIDHLAATSPKSPS
jgi:transcriptional regulator with XRE-family HTH domain